MADGHEGFVSIRHRPQHQVPRGVRWQARSLPMEPHRGYILGLIEFGRAVTRSVIALAAP
jgi:hypothetical protein